MRFKQIILIAFLISFSPFSQAAYSANSSCETAKNEYGKKVNLGFQFQQTETDRLFKEVVDHCHLTSDSVDVYMAELANDYLTVRDQGALLQNSDEAGAVEKLRAKVQSEIVKHFSTPQKAFEDCKAQIQNSTGLSVGDCQARKNRLSRVPEYGLAEMIVATNFEQCQGNYLSGKSINMFKVDRCDSLRRFQQAVINGQAKLPYAPSRQKIDQFSGGDRFQGSFYSIL